MEINRREFLKVVGAGGAAALAGCAPRPEKVIPYLIPHEEIVPGQAVWYASVCGECPAGCGVLAKTTDGRAIKLEGNPDHPVSRGRLCGRGQAGLQGLYNPDRFKEPLRKNPDGSFQPISWDEAERVLASRLSEARGKPGRIAFMTGLITGSLDQLIEAWVKALGGTRRLGYEAVSHEALREANRLAFAAAAIPYYDLERARLIFSFGADFLETWLSPVEHARQFAAMRTYREGAMGRFVYFGPRLSLTGANADEWIAARPGAEGAIALSMMRVILAEGLSPSLREEERRDLERFAADFSPERVGPEVGVSPDRIRVLARAFANAKPGLAMADGKGPNGAETCLAVNLLNYATGNVGETVRFGPKAAAGRVSSYKDARALLAAMEREEISVLLMVGVNPVFSLPEGERFRKAIGKVPLAVSFASFPDETSMACGLVLPDHVWLEAWGDSEPWDGIHGLQQPAMTPLTNSRQMGDVLLSLARRMELRGLLSVENFYAYLRERWKALHRRLGPGEDFEAFWEEALRRGGLFRPAQAEKLPLSPEALREPLKLSVFSKPQEGFVLAVYPSPSFYDGRMANRPWLQELPDAMTQVTWDNWVEIHPRDAGRLGIRRGDLVAIQSPSGTIEVPAYVTGDVAPGVIAVPAGQGHEAFGRYAEGRGANPFRLLSPAPEPRSGGLVWTRAGVALRKRGGKHRLAVTAGSDEPHERDIVQTIPLAALQRGAEKKEKETARQMYPPQSYAKHRWGMAIDLNACVGCGACVVACSAENNIPVVGQEEVARGREMSWIRVQRVNQGTPDEPEHRFLPMLCQHCGYAPCEPVCPVYATYHNAEGLNVQVYNRCVGTRYCSNNCPYKVRRFNWSTYAWPEPLHMQLNPDVTVREMGVMEKCTFCLQRIRAGELDAKKEGRQPRDGEIVPACVQTCPARAMVFGDLNDPESEVSKRSGDPRGYHVLEKLNTQSAITYLKKIKAGPVEG